MAFVFSVLEELALLLGADALAVQPHEHGLVNVLGEGVDLQRVLKIEGSQTRSF